MTFSLDPRLWKGLIWATAVAAAVAILIILFLDIDGWGTFAWSWLAPLFVQAVIALVLAGLFLALVRLVPGNFFSLCLSRPALLLLLVATSIAALLFISSIFDRSLDIYDSIQTIILAATWAFLTQPIQRLLKRFEPTGVRQVTSLYGQPARSSARPTYVPKPAPAEPESIAYTADRGRYSTLLNLVMGDRAKAERLIDFELGRAPYASREECIQRAIDSLGHDRRW
jgi:hypothetical protein